MSGQAAVFVLAVLTLAGCAERHDARGLVLKVDAATASVTVSHEPIPGFMDAMVMPFTAARPAELKDVGPGDRIGFRMSVSDDRTEIDRIRILSAAPADSGILLSPAKSTLTPIGAAVPDFTLTDQNERRVSLQELRGTVVVVAFIYSRCPLPDYCPRVMANLTALRDRFRGDLGQGLTLLTVTFDPTHDTPERLKVYAQRYGADVSGWHLLTGTSEEIARVCDAFGVEYWPDEGLITHTLQTAVIARDGTLAAAVEGKDFTPRQLGDLVESVLR